METLARTCQILYDKRILDAIKQTRDLEKKLIPFTCPCIPFDTPENFNNQITILSQNALFKIRNLHISGDPLTEFQCEALKQIIFEEIEIFTRDLNPEWCKRKAEEILLCIMHVVIVFYCAIFFVGVAPLRIQRTQSSIILQPFTNYLWNIVLSRTMRS